MTPSSIFFKALTRRGFLAWSGMACACAYMNGCAVFHRPRKIDASARSRAVESAVGQALKDMTRLANLNDGKKPLVCFLGVMGEGAEEFSDSVREELARSREIETVSKSDIQAALKEAGVRGTEVYIPAQRKLFTSALGKEFDYLLAGYIEEAEEHVDPDDENSRTIRKMVFRLELVEMSTNKKAEYVEDV